MKMAGCFKVYYNNSFYSGAVCAKVITTAQVHSTKPELRFCGDSNHACGVSEIHDGEDLWHWSRLEIRLNPFRRSTIPQKQFIIIAYNESFPWTRYFLKLRIVVFCCIVSKFFNLCYFFILIIFLLFIIFLSFLYNLFTLNAF